MGQLTVTDEDAVLRVLPPIDPGIYVTDGSRLFRVVSPHRSLFPTAELEDCATLELESYSADELYAMRLRHVPIRR